MSQLLTKVPSVSMISKQSPCAFLHTLFSPYSLWCRFPRLHGSYGTISAMELEMTEEILECYRNLAILVHNPAYISLMSFVWVLVIAGPYIVSAKAAASSPKVPAEQPVDDLEPPAEVEDVVKSGASPPPRAVRPRFLPKLQLASMPKLRTCALLSASGHSILKRKVSSATQESAASLQAVAALA